MELLGLLIPFLAAGGWLWWIYQADRLEREPWALVFRTFLVGAAAGLAGLVGLVLLYLLMPEGQALGPGLWLVPVNVLAMTGVIYFVPYRTPAWNEHFDGLVYGGAAGIGYGLTFTLYTFLDGPGVGFRTGLFHIPTFMLTGLIIGHYLSRSRFGPPEQAPFMWVRALFFSGLALTGVELARGLGGAVMGIEHPVASAFVYAANTVGWILAMWGMDAKHRASPYNPSNYRLPLATGGCPSCGSARVAVGTYCNHCGRPFVAWKGEAAHD